MRWFQSPDWGHRIEAETTKGPSRAAGVLQETQLSPEKLPKVDRDGKKYSGFSLSLPPFLQ